MSIYIYIHRKRETDRQTIAEYKIAEYQLLHERYFCYKILTLSTK